MFSITDRCCWWFTLTKQRSGIDSFFFFIKEEMCQTLESLNPSLERLVFDDLMLSKQNNAKPTLYDFDTTPCLLFICVKTISNYYARRSGKHQLYMSLSTRNQNLKHIHRDHCLNLNLWSYNLSAITYSLNLRICHHRSHQQQRK